MNSLPTETAATWTQEITGYLSIVSLIALNAFFVAAEYAIVKVRTGQGSSNDKSAAASNTTSAIVQNLNSYLRTTQIGIAITSVLLGIVGGEFLLHHLMGPLFKDIGFINPQNKYLLSFTMSTILLIFLHVVFGELIPKSMAIRHPSATTTWVSYPLRFFYGILYPFNLIFNGAANFFLRIVGIVPASAPESSHSEEEIRMIVTESQRTGNLTRDKLDLLENVFEFSDVTVRQIMVPRTEVVAFDIRKTLGENLSIAEATAHSRYPLVDGDLDHILGVIHMKDLFWQLKKLEMSPQQAAEAVEKHNPVISGGDLTKQPPTNGAQFLTTISRQILYVPETARINTLLREFQLKRIHMAIVIDEYGGTIGLVTFENVIEEIVGEVQDEFDQEVPRIIKENDHEYLIEGITPLDDINDELGLDLPTENADTIGGLVLSHLAKFPKPGEKIPMGKVELTVLELRKQRIHKVLLRFLSTEEIIKLTQPDTAESQEADDQTES